MHDVPLTPFGRTRMSLNSTHNGVFSVEISSGRPRCSKYTLPPSLPSLLPPSLANSHDRCGWAMVCVKGSGPLMRKTRAKRFFKAYFDSWESLYLSLDGEWLYLFSARNSPEPSYSISISQLKRIHVEIAPDNSQHTRSNSENSKSITLEDRFLVILSTISNDLIQLR